MHLSPRFLRLLDQFFITAATSIEADCPIGDVYPIQPGTQHVSQTNKPGFNTERL